MTVENHQTENHPSEQFLDFTKLPIMEAVVTLQTLALTQLDVLLPEKGVQNRGGLPAANVHLFAKVNTHRFAIRRKLYQGQHFLMQYVQFLRERLYRLLGWEWRISYPLSIQQFIAQKISQPVFIARLYDQWEGRGGRVSDGEIPTVLWPLLQELAWGDLDFQYKVATKIQNYVYHHVLVEPGELLTIRLHHNTYSILLAWSAATLTATSGRARRATSSQSRQQRLGLLRLQELGLDMTQLNRDRWASIWDQWVLYRAYRRWSMNHLPDNIAQMLRSLPLFTLYHQSLRHTSDDSIEIRETTGDNYDISLPHWNMNQPSWFDALVQGS